MVGWKRTILFAFAVVAATCWSIPAEAQIDTSRSYSFGDSLTDNEYLFWIFGTDPEIYGADPFEAMYDKAATPGDELVNFAALGSTSADVLSQVDGYVAAREAGLIDPATVVSIQGGGNDFLDDQNLLILASAPPGASEEADAIVESVKKNLLECLQLLQQVDRAQIILWTVPDVTLIPYFQFTGLGGVAAENIRRHIERLNKFLRSLGNRPQYVVLDVFRILTAVSEEPPVLFGQSLFPPPYFGFSLAIFADPIHPTAVSNAILANEMIAEINATFGDNVPAYSESELAELAGISP